MTFLTKLFKTQTNIHRTNNIKEKKGLLSINTTKSHSTDDRSEVQRTSPTKGIKGSVKIRNSCRDLETRKISSHAPSLVPTTADQATLL